MARPTWGALPLGVRTTIESGLGAQVVVASTCEHGFTPGVAAVCALDDGRSVFVKTVLERPGRLAASMHRTEIDVLRALAGTDIPHAPLRHGWPSIVDDGDTWVALATDVVDGEVAEYPRDLDAVLGAIESLGDAPRDVRRFAEVYPMFGHLEACAGKRLCHGDVHADNVLIERSTGRGVLVDWSWACGAAWWVDRTIALPSAACDGAPPPWEVWPEGAEVDGVAELVDALASFWQRVGAFADPPGVSGLRARQRTQAGVAAQWLTRLGRR
jgi:hypothetical protein